MVYAFRTAWRTFKVGYSANTNNRCFDYCSYDVSMQWFFKVDGTKKQERQIQLALERIGFKRHKVQNIETGKYRGNEFFTQPRKMKASDLEKVLETLLIEYTKP